MHTRNVQDGAASIGPAARAALVVVVAGGAAVIEGDLVVVEAALHED